MTEKKENECNALNLRLRSMENAGVRLYLDGMPASSKKIAKLCVNEESLYMPDYVTDKEGKIKEIRYDKISLH